MAAKPAIHDIGPPMRGLAERRTFRMKTFASVTETPCACGYLERQAQNPDSQITFDAELNEFHFPYRGTDGAWCGQAMIYHCPFCGGEAPKSVRASLFASVPNSEEYRLRELVRGCSTYDEAKRLLGAPDWEPFAGIGTWTPASNDRPPTNESFSTAHYKTLSDVANLVLVDYPERRFGVRIEAKYIGPPRTP